jgi:propanol-preferring alcohol dehydrogenase
MPMRNTTLRGSYVGSLEEMKELIHLLQNRPSSTMKFHRYPMSNLNEALEELRAGRVSGRLLAIAGE